MLQASNRHSFAASGRVVAMTLIAAAVLSACGGGGGDPGAVPPASGAGTGTGTGGTTPPVTPPVTTPTTAETTVSLVLADGSGNTVTSLSGGQSGTLKATVLTPGGKPAVGAIVQFTSATQDMVVFTPETGSALTDANGVAVVTVKPASYTTAGAVAVTATSVADGKTGTGGVNISIGAAPLTVGQLSFSPAPTGRLPAFSTLALNVPVTSAGQPATASTGLTLTSLCAGDGTATLVPGAISNGVQLATYTNNGCVRGRDVVTASIGNSSQTIALDVSAANIGAIQFSSTSQTGTSIVLKGSGGQGRSESAQVTYRVVDQQGNGLAGVDVDFSATTYTGGLAVSPTRATTDASGNVSTMVSSGTIPTPVRVLATATRNGTSMTGLSDTLTISTGLPIQRSMSLSAEHHNIEGGNIDGIEVDITVRLADQYGNPVTNGTAVNLVTEGGAIGSAAQGGCVTNDGGCTVKLVSQNYRPADGRVTVLAFVQGIENFTDSNGDGQYSCAGFTGAPGTYRPLIDACPVGTGEPFEDMRDPFLDTDLDGAYESNDRDLPFPFNSTSYKASGNGAWGLNYLRASTEIVFSGSNARIVDFCANGACTPTTFSGGAMIAIPAGATCTAARPISVRLTDVNNNPLPFETTVSVLSANKVTVTDVSPAVLPSTVTSGGTIHQMTVTPDAACVAGDFTLQTKTPQGKITEFKFTVN